MSLLLALALCGPALGQQIPVSGTVTSVEGQRLQGVGVRVPGTEMRTVTDANGRYSLTVPANAVLTFSMVGYRAVSVNVAGRPSIDVLMQPAIAFLEEVVVTGYTEQRRGDITGAVASVNLESVARQTTSSVVKGLDGRVAGVTVESSGSPGSRTTVRVRGISSFQNNDPLYIIDGTPIQDTYVNWLNPNDIASIQVLKDASAASIYGSRASNGVIIIETTKRGRVGPPRATLQVRTGVARPVRGYDDFLILDALDYFTILKRSYQNAGLPVPTNIYGSITNPTVPAYIWPNDGVNQTTTVDESTYSFPDKLIMPGSAGTNWWDAVFGPAFVGDYNLSVAGGEEGAAYTASFNYFNQEGTAAYNRFQRGSVRLNTAFTRGRLTVGENLALSREYRVGGGSPDDGFGEGGFLGKNILSQPVVPVYDVAGNFASGKAVGLGNNTNPLKAAWGAKDNVSTNDRILGNVFADFDVTQGVSLRTRFGFNLGQGSFAGYSPITPENSEPTTINSINENSSRFTDWTWSNTLNYTRAFGRHNLAILLGQEANENTSRFIAGGMSNLISTDPSARYLQDALGDASTKNVSSTGGSGALLSFFGKADYNFANRYFLSFTLRRDGSSRLGPANRWGTFPAAGVGWRLTESFLSGNDVFSNVMLRFGWGITGNQQIPSGRVVAQFGGGRSDTYYDVGGTNTTIVQGFRQTSLGNDSLKWEEAKSVNVGLDLEFLDGRANVTADLYERKTDNLLFGPPIPATAGVAAPPIVNIGAMRNRGIDFAISYGEASWNLSFNGSHYRNKIVRITGDTSDFFFGPITTRFGNQVINKVGYPIGAFYGYIWDGFFADAADVAAHATQDGAAPGRLKFRDTNGDGRVTLADRTVIGSPHPDFTAGLDLGLRRGAWDLSATLFGTFGNEIFEVQKEFYVFRNFSTNVRRDLLTDSWCMQGDDGCTAPNDPNAKYPRLDQNDIFSHAISSFYLDDGSYVRLRNLQIGYNVPPSWIQWLPAARIYVQAENLLTLTGYPGLDPALPAAAAFGPAGDIRDQYRGVDRGSYPSNKTISFGMTANF